MPGGDGDDERGGGGEIGQPAAGDWSDVSMVAVNARLRAFITEVRARPEDDERPFSESDAMLASWAEEALARQEAAELKLAEVERQALRLAGGSSDRAAQNHPFGRDRHNGRRGDRPPGRPRQCRSRYHYGCARSGRAGEARGNGAPTPEVWRRREGAADVNDEPRRMTYVGSYEGGTHHVIVPASVLRQADAARAEARKQGERETERLRLRHEALRAEATKATRSAKLVRRFKRALAALGSRARR